MLELDFALYDMTLPTGPMLGQEGGGGLPTDPGGWGLPDGAEVIVITNVGIDEYGEEVFEPLTLIRFPDSNQLVNYLDWKSSFDTSTPEDRGAVDWISGDVIDKDGYTLLVTQTVTTVDGQEFLKPVVLVREDGDNRTMTLSEWEAWLDKLESLKSGKDQDGG